MKAATANFPELPLARSKTAPSLTSGKVVGKRICPVREERGFTLLELTVVLALIALMLGLVVPNLYGSWRREQDRAAVRQMMAAMRTARSLAATRHRRVRVFFDLVKGRYQLEGSPQSVDVSRNFRLGEAHLAWQDRRPAGAMWLSMEMAPPAAGIWRWWTGAGRSRCLMWKS